ncbi:MmpL efflux pump, putative [Hondaea fermentalgiana]|uniref:MmpL efflux pump, putative n=1 Tax=Hondaea fermentalgiana TaxID=2315210 RepID=A0A2R5GUP0_9STRA|nr:MmpL efflux pump, putative [Hondaea fermentalgiana]|eukprot:GBG34039.1 MmpL efflux pump, putative [Hondaea fermentalgiana]
MQEAEARAGDPGTRETPLLAGHEMEQQQPLQRLGSFSDEDAHSALFIKTFSAIKRGKRYIVAVWGILMIWGALTGLRYITEARDEMVAPKGSRADQDMQAFRARFAEQSTTAPLIVYVTCKDCQVTCPSTTCDKKDCIGHNAEVSAFSHAIMSRILAYSDEHDIGYRHEALGYYFLEGTPLDKAKCQFANPDGTATFMIFEGSLLIESKKRYDLIREINSDILPSLNPNASRYEIGITGPDPMLRDGSTAAVEQSELIDAATMPFAFALLGYMVRSWRLLLISLFNMAIALAVTFGVLALLTDAIGQPPQTTTASFVEVLGLAMNTDYALFMMRRLRDESKNGRSPEVATRIMYSQAGHVVMMSSLTIICVFAGFLFMRATDLMVQGLACVTVVIMCLLVNMTNTPALLLLAPDFFISFDHEDSKSTWAGCWASCRARSADCWGSVRRRLGCGDSGTMQVDPEDYAPLNGNEGDADAIAYPVAGASPNSGALLENIAENGSGRRGSGVHEATRPCIVPEVTGERGDTDDWASEADVNQQHRMRGGPYKGWYFKFILFVTKWPRNLIALTALYVLVIPLAIQAPRLQRNCNLIQAIPRDSDAGFWYKKMLHSFPGGTMLPLYISVDGPQDKNNTLLHWRTGPELFDQVADLTNALAERTGVDKTAFNSVAMLQGRRVTYTEAKFLLRRGGLLCRYVTHELCELYQFAWKQGANALNTSALITVLVPFDPFEQGRMENFMQQVYEVIDTVPRAKVVEGIHFSGMQLSMIEDMRISFAEFPLLVGITCAVVFVLLGVMLQSAFVVVRLTLTVVLPLAGVFGLSVLVYQDGILDWMGFPQLSSSEDGLFFYVPLLSFTICVGLALDYDTLCIARVKEHRERGLAIRAAILRGTWEISTTVVSAGTIMAIAFAGLLTSSTLVVNQMSFILTTSVLFDSFIIQCCVMPCILSFADEIAWWPAAMPQENLLTLHEEIATRNEFFASMETSKRRESIQDGLADGQRTTREE